MNHPTHPGGTHRMTTRQMHETGRIQHRYGKTVIRPAGDDELALDVIGDAGGGLRFRLVLGPNGHVLERQDAHDVLGRHAAISDPLSAAAELRPRLARDAELDVTIISLLIAHREWITSEAIAAALDVTTDRARRSLARLDAGGLVECRGSTRDRQWRSQG